MAIVRPDGGTPFALVVLTRLAGVPTDEGNARIAEIAREAWGAAPVTTIERVEVERLSLPLHTPFVTALRRATTVETRGGAGDRQRRPGRARGGAAELAGARRVGGRLGGLPRGTAARGGAGPVGRPAGDLAGDRPGGGGQRGGQGRPRLRAARPGGVAAARRCRRWSPSRWASRTRSPRPPGRGWPRGSGRSSSRSAPTRPPTWPGCGPRVRARARTWPAGGRQHRLGLLRGGPRHRGARGRRPRDRAGRAAGRAPGRAGLAHVRRHVATPVMADESVFDLDDLVELVRHDAADLVNLKIAKAGGLTPALELARVARRTVSASRSGCMLESAVGVSAAAALAARVGCDVDPDLDGAWWLAPGAPYADRVAVRRRAGRPRQDGPMRAVREIAGPPRTRRGRPSGSPRSWRRGGLRRGGAGGVDPGARARPAHAPRPGRLPGLGPQRGARAGRPARGGPGLPRHAVRLGRAGPRRHRLLGAGAPRASARSGRGCRATPPTRRPRPCRSRSRSRATSTSSGGPTRRSATSGS